MTTTKTISAALKLVDSKKENLRKAFQELQSHSSSSSSVSNFSLSWSDIDSHFTSIQSSLEHKFKLIQSQQQSQPSKPLPQSQPSKSSLKQQAQSQPSKPSPRQQAPSQRSSSSPKPQSQSQPSKPSTKHQAQSQPSKSSPKQQAQSQQSKSTPEQQSQSQPLKSSPKPQIQSQPSRESPDNASEAAMVPARTELKSFCQKMDGLGLRSYIINRLGESKVIRTELPDALSHAPDAPSMVLNAVVGFYGKGANSRPFRAIRRSILSLLEGLLRLNLEIKAEVKERARNLAMEWKKQVNVDVEIPTAKMGFLHLLASYRLVDCFDIEEISGIALGIARLRESVELYRVLGLVDKIPDIIQKLICKGDQLPAVKLIFEFQLTDKFPPVPLLKDYIEESKRLGWKNGTAKKEIKALRTVIKHILEHKLESEYPKENLVKRIETLEKLQEEVKAGKKRTASAPVVVKPQQQNGNKRLRTTAPTCPASTPYGVATTSSVVPPIQQPQPPPAQPYGSKGSAPAVVPHGLPPTIAPHGSAPTVAPRGSAPTVAPRGSAPTVAPRGSAPTVSPCGSAPTVAPRGSAPTVGPRGSAPAVSLHGSASAVSPYGSVPAVSPYGSAPMVSPYGSTPVVSQHGAAPPAAPYASAPAASPYVSAPPTAPYGLAPPAPRYGSTPAIPRYGYTAAVPQYGSLHSVPPYSSSSAGVYGLPQQGFTGNQIPTGFHQYPSQSHMQSVYTSAAYNGYRLPPQQYHPAYYSQ